MDKKLAKHPGLLLDELYNYVKHNLKTISVDDQWSQTSIFGYMFILSAGAMIDLPDMKWPLDQNLS